MKEPAILVVISGPSGVGKTTVVNRLLEDAGIARAVTATTRAPRDGEVDGRDYLFLSREEFLDRVWGYAAYPSTRTVDNHIASLRAKLETDHANPRFLDGTVLESQARVLLGSTD